MRSETDSSSGKPVIRIIHNMARCGGTVICKCIGSMRDVMLLSEIHPQGTALFNPVHQAHAWHRVLTHRDIQHLSSCSKINFKSAISLIHQRCSEAGAALVIRDWSHLDFTAVPFLVKPTYRLTLVDTLSRDFTVRNVFITRHPVDQWISLRQLAVVQGKLSFEMFMRGYCRYAERCSSGSFIRYEDFTGSPDDTLQKMCAILDIDFDPHYAQKWQSYTSITGDVISKRGGTTISPVPRQTFEYGLLETCASNSDYLRSLSLLGYTHPA